VDDKAKKLQIGEAVVDLSRALLLDVAGHVIPLRRKAFDTLKLLVLNQGRTVPRDRMLQAIWPNATVTEESVTQCVREVRRAIGDLKGEVLRTIPGRGYVLDIQVATSAPVDAAPADLENRPSIAVLPFTNMSGDPEQEYFADGVVEEIISALSRVRAFFVISRNSTFTYKGKAVDPRQVGREMGVRYVLEGSVRRAGDRLRIGAHLVDGTTGAQIWNGRYGGEVADIFDLQDRVTEAVVGAIEPSITLSEIERARRKRPDNLSAYDCVMRALPAIWSQGIETTADGLRWAERAMSLDAGYALPRALAAWCHAQRPTYFRLRNVRIADMEADRRKATSLAREAVRLDNSDPLVLTFAGAAYSLTREYLLAESLIEKALHLDPNSAWTWTRSGWINVYLRQPDRAIEHFQRSMRLSPVDPMTFNILAGIGAAHVEKEDYAGAARWVERGLREQPDALWLNRILTVAYFHSGGVDRAKVALGVLLEKFPNLTISGLVESATMSDFAKSKFEEAFRALGLPNE
jgi:adenylate cyclase